MISGPPGGELAVTMGTLTVYPLGAVLLVTSAREIARAACPRRIDEHQRQHGLVHERNRRCLALQELYEALRGAAPRGDVDRQIVFTVNCLDPRIGEHLGKGRRGRE